MDAERERVWAMAILPTFVLRPGNNGWDTLVTVLQLQVNICLGAQWSFLTFGYN